MIMTYIDIYRKLGSLEVKEGEALTNMQRLRFTIRIAKCSSTIREEICKYLDTNEQPDYSLTLTFRDKTTGELKTTTVTCIDVQNKMSLHPLPAMLYMDWLRREPEQAVAFIIHKDSIIGGTVEELRSQIDPVLLAKADKARENKEQVYNNKLSDEL